MTLHPKALRSALCVLFGAWALAPAAQAESRGELLYATHCISCHTEQVHWRDKSVVSDWTSLVAQVRRWQGTASLAWNDADIVEVARYLNDSVYHLKQTTAPVTLLLPSARDARAGPSSPAQ